MANVFAERHTISSVADVDKLVELKGKNPTVYQTVVKKDGSEVAASNGLVIAVAKIGEWTCTVHNDVTDMGLKALKKFIEAGEIPEKHIAPTRTGKGLVIKLALKNGKTHNTHIYVRKPKNSNNAVSVSEDDIDW